MCDQEIPYCALVMLRGEPFSVTAELPPGYSFKFYQAGMEEDWCRIHLAISAFADRAGALRLFEREFASKPQLLRRRMLFVCAENGQAVATASLWQGSHLGRLMERVHWVAGLPEVQGKGLGKAMIARLMQLYEDEGLTDGIYLTTQTSSYKAINIYRQFGFEPYYGPLAQAPGGGRPPTAEETRLAWRRVNEKLAAYDHAGRPAAGPNFSPAVPLLYFEHERQFGLDRSCKVFARTYPQQSGNCLHSHNYTQIWYVSRGSCEHFVEGTKHVMQVGDMFLLPPKVIHSTKLCPDSSIICAEFNLEQLFPQPGQNYEQVRRITESFSFSLLFQEELNRTQPKFTLSCKGQRHVEKLMLSLLEEYTEADLYFEDILHLQIMALLLVLAREYAKSPLRASSEGIYDKYKGLVREAVHYIDEHYAEQLTLDEMCRISMVSKTYFCYLFKLLTGQTFIEYLTDVRISRAMELLRSTEQAITEIGQAVGFGDATHFSRTFKKLRGISPREYRKHAQEQPG